MGRKPPALKLYWCTTDDHGEDWFIVARSARRARWLHEDEEGYGPGDAAAELVCRLPPDLQEVEEGWPDHEVIVACGGTFIRSRQPRIMSFRDAQYTEGADEYLNKVITDDMFEARGAGRPNGTIRRAVA